MKKRIFDDEYPCPCSVKKDMETSEDVYIFLENFYEGLDTFDWDRFGLADLECAYCLLQSVSYTHLTLPTNSRV